MHTVVAETSGSGVLPLHCENSTFALLSLSVRLRSPTTIRIRSPTAFRLRSMTAVAELFPERRLPSGVEVSRSTVVERSRNSRSSFGIESRIRPRCLKLRQEYQVSPHIPKPAAFPHRPSVKDTSSRI